MGTDLLAVYDLPRILHDMHARGWRPSDLARKAKLANKTVLAFLAGQRANPGTGFKISQALRGKTQGGFYLLPTRRKPARVRRIVTKATPPPRVVGRRPGATRRRAG